MQACQRTSGAARYWSAVLASILSQSEPHWKIMEVRQEKLFVFEVLSWFRHVQASDLVLSAAHARSAQEAAGYIVDVEIPEVRSRSNVRITELSNTCLESVHVATDEPSYMLFVRNSSCHVVDVAPAKSKNTILRAITDVIKWLHWSKCSPMVQKVSDLAARSIGPLVKPLI